jgi:hypothetical protein
MTTEISTTTKATVVDGHVYLPLPENQFIKLTPDQARDLGMAVFLKAFDAEGTPAPSFIILKEEGRG